LEEDAERRSCLPHLYGHPEYKWQEEFRLSRAELLFLTCANQAGKSTTQIKKHILWATEKDLWSDLWHDPPISFWYLYPSLKVFDSEVRKKWIPEFLPRGRFKDDPKYGWTAEKATNGLIQAINFNSGVSIMGKSYMQEPELLQTGTCWYLSFDEEMPVELWPELQMRVAATEGYISGVFTPTLSQQFWADVMEGRGKKEKLPDAHKIRVSLYDCLTYADGTPSRWTEERITKLKNTLPTEDEINRRIYGRFIINKAGLRYPSFSSERNYKGNDPVPKDWCWFAGIDSGSGGIGKTHPAAISFIAVSPDFTKGRVVEVWRGKPENVAGDDKNTTAGDILKKYVDMKGDREVIKAWYDYNDRDLGIIAEREGIPLERAEKRHEFGEGLLNTLFKNDMLSIDKTADNRDLVDELITLKREEAKNKAKDDAIDSVRYGVAGIPWDLSKITGTHEIKVDVKNITTAELMANRALSFAKDNEDQTTLEMEIEELNEQYRG
jgi:phage terminase large subunit-like protein